MKSDPLEIGEVRLRRVLHYSLLHLLHRHVVAFNDTLRLTSEVHQPDRLDSEVRKPGGSGKDDVWRVFDWFDDQLVEVWELSEIPRLRIVQDADRRLQASDSRSKLLDALEDELFGSIREGEETEFLKVGRLGASQERIESASHHRIHRSSCTHVVDVLELREARKDEIVLLKMKLENRPSFLALERTLGDAYESKGLRDGGESECDGIEVSRGEIDSSESGEREGRVLESERGEDVGVCRSFFGRVDSRKVEIGELREEVEEGFEVEDWEGDDWEGSLVVRSRVESACRVVGLLRVAVREGKALDGSTVVTPESSEEGFRRLSSSELYVGEEDGFSDVCRRRRLEKRTVVSSSEEWSEVCCSGVLSSHLPRRALQTRGKAKKPRYLGSLT